MFSPTLLLNKGQNYCIEINVHVIVFYCLYDTDLMFNCNSMYTLKIYINWPTLLLLNVFTALKVTHFYILLSVILKLC